MSTPPARLPERLRPPVLASRDLRISRWRLDPAVAHLAPAGPRYSPVPAALLGRHLAMVRAEGFRGVVTAALATADLPVFLAAGFRVVERLHLLRHDLGRRPRRSPLPTRRARRRDLDAILAVDQAAFVPFWQLDAAGLHDARCATRRARVRVVEAPDGSVAGYAICGRSGPRGYVQRLAVHPDHQRRGFGSALLTDGLGWLVRWGAHDALVNTQLDNQRSLGLYQRVGFQLQPSGLAVLRLDFGTAGHDQLRTSTADHEPDRVAVGSGTHPNR